MAKTVQEDLFSGPLPGENFLSDTRNQAWHKPPQFTSVDAAIEYSIQKLLDKKRSKQILTMLEMGVSVVQVTDIYLTAGMGQGKWTPDFALLMAGPVAHIVKMMADGYGIDYVMGLEDNEKIPTKNYFDNAAALKEYKGNEKLQKDITEEVLTSPNTSLMTMEQPVVKPTIPEEVSAGDRGAMDELSLMASKPENEKIQPMGGLL